MRTCKWFIALLMTGLSAHAAEIAEDFNRADVGPTSNGSAIGAGWVIAPEISTGTSTDWSITNGALQTVNSALIYHEDASMGSAVGSSWEIRADVTCSATSPTKYIGVVLNYDPIANHGFEIFIRMPESGFGAYAYDDGSTLDAHTGGSHSVGVDETVRIIVSYDAANECLQMDVWDTGLTTKLAADTFENLDETLFSGGYMGLVVKGAATYTFDNVVFSGSEIVVTHVTDHFNRADAGPTSDGSAIGSGWVIAPEISTGTSTDWSITNGTLRTVNTALIYNTNAVTDSAADTSWEIRADVSCDYGGTSTKYIGVVLNYDPAANHGFELFMRLPENGFGAYAYDGSTNLDSHTGGSHAVGADETVRIIVSYDAANERLRMDVWDTGLTTKLAADTFENLDETLFSGGYMGLVTKGSGATYVFDNVEFKLPDLQATGYAGWADQWGGTNVIGSASADFDGDGLSNLYEYGLDGSPANALDSGTLPEYTVLEVGGTNVLRCIHPLRSATDELTYSLALTTNLVSEGWVTNAGYTVTGTNVTSETLNFVTNTIPMEENRKFIRLIIEQAGE